jgi:hypothetical protein
MFDRLITAPHAGATQWNGRRIGPVLVIALSCLTAAGGAAQAAAFDSYQHQETFALPDGAGVFDVLPDGRIITTVGTALQVETAAGSRTFTTAGALPGADFNDFGPAFLRVSPDGSRVAVGNGGGASFGSYAVGVFSLGDLSGGWYALSHYDAEWADGAHLALTAGTFGDPARVDVLDTASPFGAPDATTVIDGVGGASGGIAFDGAGRLYTANGFAGAGPSDTGAIRAFEFAAWSAALSGGSPLAFETAGSLIGDVLSGTSLGFDGEGNLHVGGGDFNSGDFGYAALLRASALAGALGGGGPVGGADVRAFDPDGANPFNFYDMNYNAAMGELYIREGGTVYSYAVPEPGSLALLAAGIALLLPRRGTRMRN